MITIEVVRNGYILRYKDDEKDAQEIEKSMVIEQTDDDDNGARALKTLFNDLADIVGYYPNSHHREVVYVKVAPGRDHADFKGLDYDYDRESYDFLQLGPTVCFDSELEEERE